MLDQKKGTSPEPEDGFLTFYSCIEYIQMVFGSIACFPLTFGLTNKEGVIPQLSGQYVQSNTNRKNFEEAFKFLKYIHDETPWKVKWFLQHCQKWSEVMALGHGSSKSISCDQEVTPGSLTNGVRNA